MTPLSPMGSMLNLGNNQSLTDELKDSEAEERRKRLQQAQQQRAMGPAAQLLGLGVA